MATTNNGIWTPDQVDSYNLVGDLATMASTVDGALEERANAYRGTTAQRTAFTDTAPEGTIWVDTNGEKIVWVKQGNSWQQIWPSKLRVESYHSGQIFSSIASGVSEASGNRVEVFGNIATCRISLLGVSRSSGNQSTSLGVISSSLLPVGATSLGAYYTNGSARIAMTSGGSVSLRWASSSGSNQLFIGGSWVLDD